MASVGKTFGGGEPLSSFSTSLITETGNGKPKSHGGSETIASLPDNGAGNDTQKVSDSPVKSYFTQYIKTKVKGSGDATGAGNIASDGEVT